MSVAQSKPGGRVRIFVDFWNFELSLKEIQTGFRVDWFILGPVLVEETRCIVGPETPMVYQGMGIYGSYDSNNPNEENLRRWASRTLPKVPGAVVRMFPRRRKAMAPKCPSCQNVVSRCTVCGADMRGTEEKGVDTAIATDMISLAWDDNYDVAVLVSSDRDFIPVVESLSNKGIKVIHGSFPPKASELTHSCWSYIDIPDISQKFRLV